MAISKKINILFPVILAGIYLAAWILQGNLFLNWDVSQLLYVTKLMLKGGKYGTDYFTPNPPLIFYLYMPPVILSHFFSLSIILTFRFYIFFISAISLFICYKLSRKIFSSQDLLIANIFILGIAIVFLILPSYQFGQRDHLLVIFTLPYLLAIVCRLQGSTIRPYFMFIIGLLAGLGFALKPQFLIMLVLVELYYMYCKKNLFSCIRIETITILGLMLVYAITTFVYHREFFTIMAPFVAHNYYNYLSLPWFELLDDIVTEFVVATVLIYLIVLKDTLYKELCTVLLVALIGFVLTYFAQKTALLYHKIPEFSLAILLLLVSWCLFFKRYQHAFSIGLGILFFSIPIYITDGFYEFANSYKIIVLNKLTSFVQKLSIPHQSLYVFAQAGNIGTPLIDYTNMTYAQRFDSFWVAIDVAKKIKNQGENATRAYIRNNTDKMFFLNMVVDDFIANKPDLVFVDTRENNFAINGGIQHFNYLSYFLENSHFRNVWSHYAYAGMINSQYDIIKIKVYKRLPDKRS